MQNVPQDKKLMADAKNKVPIKKINPEKGSPEWAHETEQREDNVAKKRNRPDKRTRQQQNKNPPRNTIDPAQMKAVRETAPKNDPLYDMSEFSNSVPSGSGYVQNIDMSGLGAVILATYNKLREVDLRLERCMSFSVFQHVMCSRTIAHLIAYLQSHGDARFVDEGNPHDIYPTDVQFPASIWHYLSAFGDFVTPGGEVIRINVPTGCLPGVAAGTLGAGFLGDFTVANAQRYSCYYAPGVTKAAIVASQAEGAAAWNPFPDGHFIAGLTFNENLLGYRAREHISPDFRNRNNSITFNDGDNMSGRLCYSEQAEIIVNCALRNLEDRFEMKKGFPPFISNNSLLAVCELNQVPGGNRIADYTSSIFSAYQLTQETNCRAGLFSLRRHRTATYPGIPANGPANNADIAQMLEHVNDNYEMAAGYVPVNASTVDYPTLRNVGWVQTPSERSRIILQSKWMTSRFIIKK